MRKLLYVEYFGYYYASTYFLSVYHSHVVNINEPVDNFIFGKNKYLLN